jgi:hypothetical protein
MPAPLGFPFSRLRGLVRRRAGSTGLCRAKLGERLVDQLECPERCLPTPGIDCSRHVGSGSSERESSGAHCLTGEMDTRGTSLVVWLALEAVIEEHRKRHVVVPIGILQALGQVNPALFPLRQSGTTGG